MLVMSLYDSASKTHDSRRSLYDYLYFYESLLLLLYVTCHVCTVVYKGPQSPPNSTASLLPKSYVVLLSQPTGKSAAPTKAAPTTCGA